MYRTSVIALALGVLGPAFVVGQTVETYENSGTVTTPPQINARNFVNKGRFYATNDFLRGTYYYPYNTQNYTNQGYMEAGFGFDFRTVPTTGGQRLPAFNFINANGATVTVGQNLQITADNVVNRGTLSAGSGGRVTITAPNADLSRSIIQGGTFSTSAIQGGFLSDHWGIDYGYPGSRVGDYRTNSATTPSYTVEEVRDGGYRLNTSQLSAPSFGTEVYYRQSSLPPGDQGQTTNYFQAVYLVLPFDFDFSERTEHALTFYKTNDSGGLPVDQYARFSPVLIDWSTTTVDPVTGGEVEVALSFRDNFAQSPDTIDLITNSVPTPTEPYPTGQPNNFDLERMLQIGTNLVVETPTNLPGAFPGPIPANSPIRYSAWGVSSIASTRRIDTNILAAASYTNLPGRVEITAGDLNMNFTRLTAENYLSIKATNHFSGNFRSTIMAPMNDISLHSTNSVLSIEGLMPDELPVIVGQIQAYSSFWTRKFKLGDNEMEENFAVLVVDASSLRLATPEVKDLDLTAGNLVLNDILNIGAKLKLDTESLTVAEAGHLNLTSELLVWADSLPSLTALTNKGIISAINEVKFMQDSQPASPEGFPYQWIVNEGEINVGGLTAYADNLVHSGTIETSFGDVDLRFGNANLTGLIESSGSVELSGSNADISTLEVTANDRITIAVDGVLTDSGLSAENRWEAGDAFDLLVKPVTGDFRGKTLLANAGQFAEFEIQWAGEDRGANESGFQNNGAVGRLWLNGGFGSLFTFRPVDGQNAIYIENLALTPEMQFDLANSFAVDPNFTVYFRNLWTFIPDFFDPYEDVSFIKPSELEAATGGRFRAVGAARASVALRNAQGQVIGSIDVDAALRNSSTIDSDADGVVNQADDYPFDGPVLQSAAATGGKVTLTWNAAANTKYTLWTTQNFTNWTQVTEITSGGIAGPIEVQVPAGASGSTFKLSYTP